MIRFSGAVLGIGIVAAVLATPSPTQPFAAHSTLLDSRVEEPPPQEESPAPSPEDFSTHCSWALPPADFSLIVHRVAEEANLNPRVLALTVYKESRCRADAKGGVGEIGLGQIYPAVWESALKEKGIIYSVDDLYDPEANLRATAFVLNEAYASAQGQPVDALRIYNGRGKRAIRYAAQQRDKYHALWGEDVFFRPRPTGTVRPLPPG